MSDVLEHLGQTKGCVVSFASGGGDCGDGLPHFEFGRTLRGIGLSYVLLRDSRERWYLDGVEGIGDEASVAAYIGLLGSRYDRLLTVGLSSGAFAALKFGWLARVDEVIAMSPLTAIGTVAVAEFGPDWAHRVNLPPEYGLGESLDVAPFYTAADRPYVRAFVSDGEGTELDRRMAERIGSDEITLIPGCSHARLARRMIETGQLQKALLG